MLESHSTEGTPSFKGSAMLLMAESEEQAKELLSKDIYVRSGVWDLEKAQIIPIWSHVQHACDYSFALGWSIASATLRRCIFPVAVFGICVIIQTCCML
ncbi:uncharacterized protein AFUA_4G06860 [Aspergillus fumigatus Af293]|uniref:YCII-related domain-containing protein n=2 Tax=Aspergillus fumigatus TaxID=746128 RepID=Q4WNT2_ASPFU|nr:conserved hypothetical protein [Aspergillus fumigatus Af293]EAL90102.1 conserved hypothetical protein [Aspergillus fumigatus Af293]EDP50062.1 conserved hypothetical protein [Aspergillus fumigatus A1163]